MQIHQPKLMNKSIGLFNKISALKKISKILRFPSQEKRVKKKLLKDNPNF
jgi:hypothetical protein